MVFVLCGALLLGFFLWQNGREKFSLQAPSLGESSGMEKKAETSDFVPNPSSGDVGFFVPLDRAKERVTKKPFGIFIDSKTSPVQPERFRGYHTGTDFEVFPEEANADVSVRAVCSGKLVLKRWAPGYGGVVAQECSADGEWFSVVYGHLNIRSVSKKRGDVFARGEEIGVLGVGGTAETDGERKHLHLGFRKGRTTDIRGYVASRSELSLWVDPCSFLCK